MQLFKGSRDQILLPLQIVGNIVEKRSTLPILSNVLIEKLADKLTFLATDIEIQMRTAAPAQGSDDIALTVGARKLQDILRSLPEDAELSLNFDNKRLLLKAGKSKFTLQTLPAEEFPRMAMATDGERHFSMPQNKLKRLLSLVQYAMAQQDIRYYLNGLMIVVEDSLIRLVATDGHRLAYVSESIISQDENRLELILPRKAVLELSRQLADTDDEVHIALAAAQAHFRFGNVEMVSKLIDGKFPDYERVIPQQQMQVVTLNRAELLHSMQRVAILTSDKFRGIRIMLTEGSLKIAASNAEHEEAQEEIEVNYQGDPLEVGFNVTYLLDVLSNINTEQIECRLSDPSSSALFTLPGNDNFKYVVMPMRI